MPRALCDDSININGIKRNWKYSVVFLLRDFNF